MINLCVFWQMRPCTYARAFHRKR